MVASKDVKKLPLGIKGIKVDATNKIAPNCIKFCFLLKFIKDLKIE